MKYAALLCGFLTLTLGCSGPQSAQPLARSDKATVRQQLDTQTSYHGKRVALEGYLFLANNTASEEEGRLYVSLYTEPMGAGERLVDLLVGAGQGKNQLHLPTTGKGKSAGYNTTQYKLDLSGARVFFHDGSAHDLKTRVRVSGTVRYVPQREGGFSHQEDPLNKGVQLYPFSLESLRLEAAP